MAPIFGNFIDKKMESCEYLKMGFSPSSAPIQQRWRNNGLSADFLADYLSTFFPGKDPASSGRQAEIKGAISYIANELLENAMKFSDMPSQHAVYLSIYLEEKTISLYVTNSIDPNTIETFQHFIHRLLTEDTDTLYMEQLSRNAAGDHGDKSGLGFLTILNDYGATLAWKFEPLAQDVDVMTVTTMACLSV